MAAQNKENRVEIHDSLFMKAIFGVFLVLLFYPPFVKGLFFEQELLPYHILSGTLFLCFIWCVKKQFKFINGMMDIAALGLLLAYLLSSIHAVAFRDAIWETLKIVNYLIVYFLVSYFAVSKEQNRRTILKALFLSGVGTALVGIGSATNLFYIANNITSNRLASVFSYPNSFAAYLSGILILGLYLATTTEKKYFASLYSGANYIIILSFFWTQSRGAIVFAVISLVLILVGPAKGRIPKLVASLLSALILAVIASNYAMDLKLTDGRKLEFIVIFGIVAMVFGFFSYKLDSVKDRIKNKKIILGGFLVLVFIGIIVLGASKMDALSRFKDISFADRNVQERLVFFKDALKVIGDYPLLGTGGGGWGSLYREYQSHLYLSRAVHNYYLQTWVEAGLLGIISLIGIWGALLMSGIRILRKNGTVDAFQLWSIFVAAIMIGMHSLMDFNLMFGSISILLWALFGLIRGAEQGNQAITTRARYQFNLNGLTARVSLSIFMVIFVAGAGVLLSGLSNGDKGIELKEAGKNDKAEDYLEKAHTLDPFEPSYSQLLSEIWRSKGTKAQRNDLYKTNSKLETALEYANLAVKGDRGDPDLYINRGKILMRTGRFEEAVNDYQKAIKLFPLNIAGYQNLAEAGITAGKQLINRGEKEKAKACLEAVTAISDEIADRQAKLTPLSDTLWNTSYPKLKMTPDLKSLISEAQALLAQL